MIKVFSALLSVALGQRITFSLDNDWRFKLVDNTTCVDLNNSFPIVLDDVQCMGLSSAPANSLQDCADACCDSSGCMIYQWCPPGQTDCSPSGSCWIGYSYPTKCQPGSGWQSRARASLPSPPPLCDQPECDPNFDDGAWRVLSVPHDFVVEGAFDPSADMNHGYLPYGRAYYRKHFKSSSLAFDLSAPALWLDFEGIQTYSIVWLNGFLLGTHASGYTPSRYFIDPTQLTNTGDNVLVVYADATDPDGWWYDGGGIYRHVWLTAVDTPGPFLGPHGVYAPSTVQGNISFAADGTPYADSLLSPSVEIWSNASNPALQTFDVKLRVINPGTNRVLAVAGGSGTVSRTAVTVWTPATPLQLTNIALWHLVSPPARPSLLILETALLVDGNLVDETNQI
jgi:hypothetical protein